MKKANLIIAYEVLGSYLLITSSFYLIQSGVIFVLSKFKLVESIIIRIEFYYVLPQIIMFITGMVFWIISQEWKKDIIQFNDIEANNLLVNTRSIKFLIIGFLLIATTIPYILQYTYDTIKKPSFFSKKNISYNIRPIINYIILYIKFILGIILLFVQRKILKINNNGSEFSS